MKKQKKRIMPWIVLGLAAVFAACVCRVTVIPDEAPEMTINEAGETVVVEKLTVAQQYCIDNWESKIIPSIHERAVEFPEFLSDVASDLDAAGNKYGNRANETSPWSFCVKGEGRVIGLENADKPNKTVLLLDISPFDGIADIGVHYGKVFPSNIKNAIRDGVGFLKLDNFANQVEFADLTTAFNTKVKDAVFSINGAEGLSGKLVSVYGCISLQDVKPESLVVVPVELSVLEE